MRERRRLRNNERAPKRVEGRQSAKRINKFIERKKKGSEKII